MKVAMIYNLLPDFLGYGGFLQRGMEQFCDVTHFVPGEEQEGYDHYYYVDDGPTAYMEPKYRPATYFAMDMVVKPFWYLDPVEHYLERCRNFDQVFTTSIASTVYCRQRGVAAKMLGFAADPDYHKTYPNERNFDWVAVWHNCGDRIEAANAALLKYPNGWVTWRGNEQYSQAISQGKCALNWLRGDIGNMRTFEVMATGVPLIQSRHPDMLYYGFMEDKHYLGFEGVDEMLNKIGWVLANPLKATKIAERARSVVMVQHTYKHGTI